MGNFREDEWVVEAGFLIASSDKFFRENVGDCLCEQPFSSTGGPGHYSAAEDVHMNMEDCLAGNWSIIEYNPEILANVVFSRYFTADSHNFANEYVIFLARSRWACNMFFGDYQEVFWCLRGDIPERHHIIIFVELFSRDITGGNFTE